MPTTAARTSVVAFTMALTVATAATAQPLGTFTWQLQPFCNRITVTVTQNGSIYTLDGTDDQCNAGQRAPVTGLATPNPDGTIGLGFNVVTVPGGAPVAIDARIPFPNLTGTWSDSAAIGERAIETNVTGHLNTAVGQGADVATAHLTNATAIGANAEVSQDNSLVLGSINGVNNATASTRVGIGVTAPQATVDLEERIGGNRPALRITRRGNADLSTTVLGRYAPGNAGPQAVPASSVLASFGGVGHDGTAYGDWATGRVDVVASEAWTPTAHGTRLLFRTGANGTINTSFLALVIDHNQQVGIGEASPADLLDVDGDLRVGTTGASGCVKRADGNVLVGACSSDARFKRDVTAFSPALARVAMLQPVHFYWRADAFPAKRFGETQAYGLVAQEVEAVLPELVSTDADGFKTVDYAKLPLLAIQAIKELRGENEALRDGQAALERRLAALEAAMTTRRD